MTAVEIDSKLSAVQTDTIDSRDMKRGETIWFPGKGECYRMGRQGRYSGGLVWVRDLFSGARI